MALMMQSSLYKRFECESREEWLALRKRYLTASDVPAILGQVPWDSPLAVFGRKLGLIDEKEETEAMRFGKLLQPIVRDAYVEETKRQVTDVGEYTLLVSERWPFLACTLDYLIEPIPTRPGEGTLEVKTTGAFHRGEWSEGPPIRSQIQLQMQLIVTGLLWGSVAGLIGGQSFRWADVDPDVDFQEAAVQAVREFHRRLELKDPPPADWGDSSKAVLKALYPQETGETIALPDEAHTWYEQWEAGRKLESQGKKQKDEFGNLIRQAIGSATFGVLAGVGKFKLATVSQPEKTIQAFSYRNLTFSKKG